MVTSRAVPGLTVHNFIIPIDTLISNLFMGKIPNVFRVRINVPMSMVSRGFDRMYPCMYVMREPINAETDLYS